MRMCFLVMPEWWLNQHHRDGITRLPLIARRMKSRAAPGRCGPESITMIDATRPSRLGRDQRDQHNNQILNAATAKDEEMDATNAT